MRFVKMHGLGNDYVYVNGFTQPVDEPAALARRVSDRHLGVGSDGLILLLPPGSSDADVRMRMFNADGSESEMCGNGIRCVCKLAHDEGLTRANPMRVATGRGVLTLRYTTDAKGKVDQVTVDMGKAITELAQVPVEADRLDALVREATFVSMGNPHAVFFVEDVKAIDLATLGPRVEHHPAFPRRINAHWVRVNARNDVTMVTWERGSGITMACGTGACAVAMAGVMRGLTDAKLTAHLPGGDLHLFVRDDHHVEMTGPAVEVFRGELTE